MMSMKPLQETRAAPLLLAVIVKQNKRFRHTSSIVLFIASFAFSGSAWAFSQEAQAVFNNMSALSPSEKASIATFVDQQVDVGNWRLIDEMYCFALNETDSLTGFKRYANAVSDSGMTHSAGAGYTAELSDSYINSNIIPATLAAESSKNFAINDAMASVYLHEAALVGNETYALFGAYDSRSDTTEFGLDYTGSPPLLRAALHSGAATVSTGVGMPFAKVATIVRRGIPLGTIEVWLNDSQEASLDTSATALADRPIHIAGRSNGSSHESGSGQKATYSIFAIGGGSGFDVDAWQRGVRELLYDLGHRPRFYVSGGAEGAAFDGYGTSDSPYSLITGSPLENLTGDQFGLKILFEDDTVLYDSMVWEDISRLELGATNDGINKPIIDGSQLISLSDTPTRIWTEQSAGIYSAPFPEYPGDIGIYITDDGGTTYHMAHWRKNEADFLDPLYDQYSAGYIKWFDYENSVMYVKSSMNLTTDEGSAASMMRIGKHTKVLRMSSSSIRTVNDITIRDLRFQRGSTSIVKIGGIGHGLRVDNVEAHEAGDWGYKKPDLKRRESGFHAFAIIGDRANKATGVHFSNIQTHSQWNINGNAIETRNLTGAIFEDWVAYDLGNNVYELWEEMEDSIFRRTKAWNAKALVWMANENNTSNPDLNQVHRTNVIENNYFRSYDKYNMPTGDKAAVLVASGVDNIFQSNTLVGMKTEIIKENVKYNGEISGNIYRNNIIYMADIAGNKGVVALAGPVGDANLSNNVIQTLGGEPDSVKIITEHVNDVSGVKKTLPEWQALGHYTSNVVGDPMLVNVKGAASNPADTSGPDLRTEISSAAAGLADSNMPLGDVTGATRIGNSAGAYDQPFPASSPSQPIINNINYGDSEAYIRVTVADNGGSPINGYDATCTDGVTEYSGNSTTPRITVSGLTNGVSYTCSSTAINAAGFTSTRSAPSPAIIPEEFIPVGLPLWLLYEAAKRLD